MPSQLSIFDCRANISKMIIYCCLLKTNFRDVHHISKYIELHKVSFYRAMHYIAKRGIAIACRQSDRLQVCNVGGSGLHRLEILETNCTDN